ncbi:glycosyltransferase [Candidatus Micrarchaeota archaeon]|nr:glycosyltransferase [Candidatus Micrarchaeota archaeon]
MLNLIMTSKSSQSLNIPKITDSVAVVIPTLNEEQGIEVTINSIPKEVSNLPVFIYVIDGGSTDKTIEITKKTGVTTFHQTTRGKGAAILEFIGQIEPEIIVLIDGDSTYEGKELQKLVGPILEEKADMVVSTRFEKMESGAMSSFNKFGNWIFRTILGTYGIKIEDMLSGYRSFRKSKFLELALGNVSFEIETYLTSEAIRHRWKILEIPLPYYKRKGKTKLNPIRDGWLILRAIVTMLIRLKPVPFFSSISILLLLLSIYPTALVTYEKFVFGEIEHQPSVVLAAFLIIMAVQFFFFGVMMHLQLSSMD